jgi:hypothetical protein
MYKIILANGIELGNLELNGNNYISTDIIDSQVFENNLLTVTINDGETDTIHSNMKLIQNIIVDGKSWFILAEKTAEELRNESADKDMSDMADIVAALLGV